MSNWLAKFSPSSLPAFVRSPSFDGIIKHGRWTEEWDDKEGAYKVPGDWKKECIAFANPDARSGVSGIEVHAFHVPEGRHVLTIYLINRPGFRKKNVEFARAYGLGHVTDYEPTPTNPVAKEIDIPVEKTKLYPEGAYTMVGLNEFRYLERGSEVVVQEFQKAMQMLAETDLISRDPAIRQAMVDTMSAQLVSVKALSSAPKRIVNKDAPCLPTPHR